ncbi:MAG: glycosyltransferase family 4 protein [Chitinophagales bacterium]
MPDKKIKITYILFQLNKALAFEWIVDHIDKSKYELSFISIYVNENSFFEHFCKERNIEFHRIEYASKKSIPAAIFQTYKLLKKIKPDAVHCHIFEANIIGLTAAYLAGIKKRIFTRHHSSYHHITAPSGLKYDKYCNKLATHIIAISQNVKNILVNLEHVPEKKITLIHHGFDLPLFYNITEERLSVVEKKYNPENKHPVIGLVSRYTKWKGLKYAIAAFKQLLQDHPNALLVLANAKGEDLVEVKQNLSELPMNSYVEIEFENDNGALFKLFDVFVHVPIDADSEAFGQTYIEALAVGVPSVFTFSGVACEFIEDGKNAIVVDYQNSEQIYQAIHTILADKELDEYLFINGRKDIEQYFSLPLFIQKLEQIYSS